MQILCTMFEFAYPIERDVASDVNEQALFKLDTKFTFPQYVPNLPAKNRPQSASGMSGSEHASLPIPDIDLSSELITKTPKVGMRNATIFTFYR